MADISDLRIDHPSRSAPASNPWRSAFIALIVIVAAGAALAYFLLRSTQHTTVNDRGVERAPEPRNAPPSAPPATGVFTAAGYVEVIPPGAHVLSSLIPGVVSEIHVREGQPIRAGDVVATLDSALLERELESRFAELEVLRARLARLEAGSLPEEIEQAQARKEAAEARLHAAQEYIAALKRMSDAEGSVVGAAPLKVILETQSEVIQAASALAEADAELRIKQRGTRSEDLAIARAELARAQTDLEHVMWRIERCTIHSPVAGVVFQQLAQPGQWLIIDSSDRASTGAAIASIFDPASLQAWVDVNQRDVHRISIGQRVTMTADAGPPGKTIEGRVIQFMPRASIERNTVRIKLSIEGEHGYLRPDMSLRVTFHE